MERLIMNELLKWKNSPYRKPLILKGVRQVGKTWILKEFGRRYYKNVEDNKGRRPDFAESDACKQSKNITGINFYHF